MTVTRADLSSEALAAISPDLTLATLAQLTGISEGHLGRMANGRRQISDEMAVQLHRGLKKAKAMAEKGTLPKRYGQGMRRST